MNREHAIAVLGISGSHQKDEVEEAYRRQVEAIVRKSKAASQGEKGDGQDQRKKEAKQLQRARNEGLSTTDSVVQPAAEPRPTTKAKKPAGKPGRSLTPPPVDARTRGDEATKTAIGKLKNGYVLANRYEIRERIGVGRMGAVFSAFDCVRHEMVAVKVFRPSLIKNPHVKEQLLSEAKIASTLTHENILRVFDFQQTDGLTFMTTELLEGRTLRSELNDRQTRNRQTKKTEILRWASQMCDALEYAHGQTVHRDVKPENIWIGADGTVKLMDFCIASVITSAEKNGKIKSGGNTNYVSPEQLSGHELDSRADQYALSVVLYEMFTGSVPDTGAEPIHKIRRNVGAGVSRVITRGLSVEPDHRFGEIGAFRDALIRKRLGAIPVRALAAALALILGLSVTYPLWPAEDRDRASEARSAAENARTVWLATVEELPRELSEVAPPSLSLAERSWDTAETFYSQGQYEDAKDVFEQAKRAYGDANLSLKEYAHHFADEHFRKYRDDFPEGETVPAVLELTNWNEAKADFTLANALVADRQFEQATQQFQDGLQNLELAAKKAEAILRYQPDWEAFTKERDEYEKLFAKWQDWGNRWKNAWPDDVKHQREWDTFFKDTAFTKRAAAMTNQIAASDSRHWPKLTRQMESITDEVRSRLQEAEKYLRGPAIKFLKDDRVRAASQQFTAIIDELQALPEKDGNEGQRQHFQQVVGSILRETDALSMKEEIARKLYEADALAQDDPLGAVQMYVGIHRQIEPALEGLRSIRDRHFATELSTINPFNQVASEAALPPLGTMMPIELGYVDSRTTPSWRLTLQANRSSDMASTVAGRDVFTKVSLGTSTRLDEVLGWPILVSDARNRNIDVGYFFVENDQLRFIWTPARGLRFHPSLFDLTLNLKSGVHSHSIRLQQLMRNNLLPVNFMIGEQATELALPAQVDQQKLRLELLSLHGIANAQGLPSQLAAGERARIYLDNSHLICLDIIFRIGNQAPEVIVRPLMHQSGRYRGITASELETAISTLERDLAADQSNVESAKQEYGNLTQQYSRLESAIQRTGINIQAMMEQQKMRQEMTFISLRGNALVSKVKRLTQNTIPNRKTLLERLSAQQEILSAVMSASPALEYRVFMPSDGGDVDLVVASKQDG